MARTIIISASDAKFHYLLDDLIRSIAEGVRQDGMALGVLDLGLQDEQRQSLAARGITLVTPDLDYDAGLFRTPPAPSFRAMTARPHLQKYFPGYDLYIFLDADCWVQDWEAVRLYASAAQRMGLAVTPEVDRSYIPLYANTTVAAWRRGVFVTCFGEEIARDLAEYPMINTGLFAARADSTVWEHWSNLLGNVYRALGEPFFFAEQTTLNALIRGLVVPAALLPSRCNWMCNVAKPACSEDGRILHEPQPPFAPLGIIHLTGPSKDNEYPLLDLNGGRMKRSLRYGAPARRVDAAAETNAQPTPS